MRTDKASRKKGDEGRPRLGSGGPVDVTVLTVRELADLLGVPSGTVREHVKAGAPCTAGRPRRLSLIEYAAWLNREARSPNRGVSRFGASVRTRGEAAR